MLCCVVVEGLCTGVGGTVDDEGCGWVGVEGAVGVGGAGVEGRELWCCCAEVEPEAGGIEPPPPVESPLSGSIAVLAVAAEVLVAAVAVSGGCSACGD